MLQVIALVYENWRRGRKHTNGLERVALIKIVNGSTFLSFSHYESAMATRIYSILVKSMSLVLII
jgi:hypothetical protein